MLITSALPLFDSIENGFTNAIINLCDCFGNISSPNSIEIRVKYPGSYAADRMTRKGDLHKLGTVSCSLENNTLVLNAYICYNFNDRMSIDNATLFDPTIFFACMHQVKDVLSAHNLIGVHISITSFIKFGIESSVILSILTHVANNVPYNLIVTV